MTSPPVVCIPSHRHCARVAAAALRGVCAHTAPPDARLPRPSRQSRAALSTRRGCSSASRTTTPTRRKRTRRPPRPRRTPRRRIRRCALRSGSPFFDVLYCVTLWEPGRAMLCSTADVRRCSATRNRKPPRPLARTQRVRRKLLLEDEIIHYTDSRPHPWCAGRCAARALDHTRSECGPRCARNTWTTECALPTPVATSIFNGSTAIVYNGAPS